MPNKYTWTITDAKGNTLGTALGESSWEAMEHYRTKTDTPYSTKLNAKRPSTSKRLKEAPEDKISKKEKEKEKVDFENTKKKRELDIQVSKKADAVEKKKLAISNKKDRLYKMEDGEAKEKLSDEIDLDEKLLSNAIDQLEIFKERIALKKDLMDAKDEEEKSKIDIEIERLNIKLEKVKARKEKIQDAKEKLKDIYDKGAEGVENVTDTFLGEN